MAPLKDANDFEALERGSYLLQLQRIEDADPGQFGPRLKWVFLVWKKDTREQVMDGDQPYEFWQFTSEKMTPRATARSYVEALLGRTVQPGESGGALAAECVGKAAEAYIAPNENGYTGIVDIYPLGTVKTAAAAPAPAAAPVAAAAPAPAASAPVPPPIDPNDLPF